jgi:hypothetical protein
MVTVGGDGTAARTTLASLLLHASEADRFPLILADEDLRIVWGNEAMQDLGWALGDLVGGLVFDWVHPEDLPRAGIAISTAEGGGYVIPAGVRIRRADGEYTVLEAARDPGRPRPAVLTTWLSDVTESDMTGINLADQAGLAFIALQSRAAREHLDHLAHHDVLTGLANRARFFAAVDEADAVAVAHRVRASAAEPIVLADTKVRVGASAGLAYASDARRVGPDELVGLADDALYRAKRAGKADLADLVVAHPEPR